MLLAIDSSFTHLKLLTSNLVSSLKVSSLEQVDALVGRYVMDDSPEVYWEHSCSHWRFESLDEALEALSDPFFTSLVPEGERAGLAVAEVREFPAYSADLATAFRVVERLGAERKPLTLCPLDQAWMAWFGSEVRVGGASPALAICLAALRVRGIEVELARDPAAELALA